MYGAVYGASRSRTPLSGPCRSGLATLRLAVAGSLRRRDLDTFPRPSHVPPYGDPAAGTEMKLRSERLAYSWSYRCPGIPREVAPLERAILVHHLIEAVTHSVLSAVPGRDWLRAAVARSRRYSQLSPPILAGPNGREFLWQADASEEKLKFMLRRGKDAPLETVVDPNTWASDEELVFAVPSPDGTLIA